MRSNPIRIPELLKTWITQGEIYGAILVVFTFFFCSRECCKHCDVHQRDVSWQFLFLGAFRLGITLSLKATIWTNLPWRQKKEAVHIYAGVFNYSSSLNLWSGRVRSPNRVSSQWKLSCSTLVCILHSRQVFVSGGNAQALQHQWCFLCPSSSLNMSVQASRSTGVLWEVWQPFIVVYTFGQQHVKVSISYQHNVLQ